MKVVADPPINLHRGGSQADPRLNTVKTDLLLDAVQRYFDAVALLVKRAADAGARGEHHNAYCAELGLRVTLGMGKPDPATYDRNWDAKP